MQADGRSLTDVVLAIKHFGQGSESASSVVWHLQHLYASCTIGIAGENSRSIAGELEVMDDYDASFDMDESELMSPVITTDTGIRMAQPRGPIVVTWTMQVCAIICTFLFVGAACIKMQFVLVPLILVRTHRTPRPALVHSPRALPPLAREAAAPA